MKQRRLAVVHRKVLARLAVAVLGAAVARHQLPFRLVFVIVKRSR